MWALEDSKLRVKTINSKTVYSDVVQEETVFFH